MAGCYPALEIAERLAGASRQRPGWVFGNLTLLGAWYPPQIRRRVGLQHERRMNGRYRMG